MKGFLSLTNLDEVTFDYKFHFIPSKKFKIIMKLEQEIGRDRKNVVVNSR